MHKNILYIKLSEKSFVITLKIQLLFFIFNLQILCGNLIEQVIHKQTFKFNS